MTREKAIEVLEYIRHTGNGESEYTNCSQSVAIDMAIKALEQEPKTECSCEQIKWERDTAIAQLKELGYGLCEKPKTGHWIEEDMFDGDVAYGCSECNELFWIESGTPKDIEYNFCPKCGAKMVEPQESEE